MIDMDAAKTLLEAGPPAANDEVADGMPAAITWAEPRNLFFFRTGRLHGRNGEELCEIFALTESGAILRSSSAHDHSDRATLEVNSVHRFEGSVAWAEDDRLGLAFDDKAFVKSILACRELSFPYRPPRLSLHCELDMQIGSRRMRTHCHDISEAGVKVELPADDCRGLKAVVALEGLQPIAGKVKWWREGRAGIAFDQPIKIATFAPWLTSQLAAARGSIST